MKAFWIPSQSIYTERYFGNLNFPEADKRKVFIFKHYNLYWIWRVGVIRQMSICNNWFLSLFLISALRCKRDHNLEEGSPVVSSSLYDISRRLTFEIWNIVQSTQLPQFVYKMILLKNTFSQAPYFTGLTCKSIKYFEIIY